MLQRTALTLLLVASCAICLALVVSGNSTPDEALPNVLMASTGGPPGPPA